MSGPSLSLLGIAAYYTKAEIGAWPRRPNAAIARLSTALTVTLEVHNPIRGVGLPSLRGYAAYSIRGEAPMAATKKLTPGQKAAQTRKRRAAGRKAAATRKRNATAAKAAATRKRNKKA
jgi:hypothetical protein